MIEHVPARGGRSIRSKAASLAKRCANRIVSPVEALSLPPGYDRALTCRGPVFIVGAPRSGSTLLYQVLGSAFDFGYITNRLCRWYRTPIFLEKWNATPFGRIETTYESEHGQTMGPHSPSECGNYWYRFLPRRPHVLDPASVDTRKLAAMRRAVAGLTAAVNRTLLFKNLILSLRIPVLYHSLPESVFVVVNRDPIDTGVSILRAREKIHGRIDRWFSVRPSNPRGDWEDLDPYDQVTGQVSAIHAAIATARQQIGAERFFDVTYERFCEAPAAEINRLHEWLSARGVEARRNARFALPERFDRNTGSGLGTNEWRDRLQERLARAE